MQIRADYGQRWNSSSPANRHRGRGIIFHDRQDAACVDVVNRRLVVTLIHNNFLIEIDERGNASAEIVEASLHAGDLWGDYIIRENVKIMIDSEIHKVEHSTTGVARALKVMQRRFPNRDMKDVIARRLTHEFSIIGRIHHPNVVRLWESGEYDGRVYGILDYADGPPIRSFAYENGKTPDDATLLEYALQCSVALGAVHEAGFLHGDVHTGNFLVKDGRVCLIDFGLAPRARQKSPGPIRFHGRISPGFEGYHTHCRPGRRSVSG
jgi:hypothetical protein